MAWAINKYGGKLLLWGDSGLPEDNFSPAYTPDTLQGPEYIKNFANDLESHTICSIPYAINSRIYLNDARVAGVGANMDKKAVIYFRDPDTLLPYHFTYPAPVAADVEDVGYGNRIKNSVVVTIVGYLSTLTGKSYIPLYGVYYQRE